MIPYVYCILLTIMLSLLYWAGTQLKHDYKIWSIPGIVAILAFTLNEGLRFGRGIDYNLYWQGYMDLARGWDSNQNIGFILIEKFFLFFNLPYQALVLFMSMMFIIGTLFLMKRYKGVVMFALPLWILMSRATVDNMVRWYLAFSFVLIGLSFLLGSEKHSRLSYIICSLIGCTIHYAMLPIPLLFYLIYSFKKPLLSPTIAIIIFAIVALLFESSMMLVLADYVNALSQISDHFSGYGENAEFWLTNNASGTDSTGLGISNVFVFMFLIIFGYKCCHKAGHNYVFAYNLFLIAAIFYTVGRRIELVGRFNWVFYFFGAIVFACIIRMTMLRLIRYRAIVIALTIMTLVFTIYKPLVSPFVNTPMKYMYVWDQKGETPQSMLQMYTTEKYKKNKNFETKKERMKQYRSH